MPTAIKILISCALALALFVVCFIGSIFGVIVLCRSLGGNPADGQWMYGILISPVVYFACMYWIVKLEKRWRSAAEGRRGFDVLKR